MCRETVIIGLSSGRTDVAVNSSVYIKHLMKICGGDEICEISMELGMKKERLRRAQDGV